MGLIGVMRQGYGPAKLIKKNFGISYISIIVHYFLRKDEPLNIVLKGQNISMVLLNIAGLVRLLNDGWEVKSIDDDYIKIFNNDGSIIRCRLRRGLDIAHLAEIWVEKNYSFDFKDKNVVDIGASNGDSSVFFAKNGARQVIASEPDRNSFLLALENVRESGVAENVTVINKAVTGKTEKREIILYDHYPNANSIDSTNAVVLDDSKRMEYIECISLKEVVNMLNGGEIGLLKMDCEGCEYESLRSLDSGYYDRIEKIVFEYHNGIQDLPNFLSKNGFNCVIKGNKNKSGYIIARKS